jgi:hypothetical protein
MFFDEKTERDILHNSTSKRPSYNTSKMIKPENMMSDQQRMPSSQYARKIGGSNGVSTLKPANLLMSSSMGGGAKTKRPLTEYQKLLQKISREQGMNLRDAMKYVKDNKLYKK